MDRYRDIQLDGNVAGFAFYILFICFFFFLLKVGEDPRNFDQNKIRTVNFIFLENISFIIFFNEQGGFGCFREYFSQGPSSFKVQSTIRICIKTF